MATKREKLLKRFVIIEDTPIARHATLTEAVSLATTEHEKDRARKFLICEIRASVDSRHETLVQTHF